ncbi:MAG: hypothetical protein ABI193_21425, partial [Minicystis sp.]
MGAGSQTRARSPIGALRGAGLLLALTLPGAALAGAPASGADPTRWTAPTPDEMVDQLLARADKGEDDALAALIVAASLDDRASFGRVRDGLARLGAGSSPLADDARWLGYRLAPAAASPVWPGARAVSSDAAPDPTGLVKTFAILGPFQDTGGGLMRREGPEAAGQSWSDTSARFAWGVYDVSHRRVLPTTVSARGLPLDLYIHPRAESCTYLGTRVTVPASAKPFLVHVAASGAVRLIWDGADVAASEDAHPRLVLDRLSARIETTAGDHLLALKVCTSAVGDEGRVRLRLTDEKRAPLALSTSSDLSGMRITAPAPSAPPAVEETPAAKPVKPVAPVKPAEVDPFDDETALAAKKPVAAPAAKKPVATPAAKKGAGKKVATAPPAVEAQASAPIAVVPPKGVTLVRTALEKALDLGAAPTTAQALSAAILRTLGGAEDGRSPRAPGLLDRITGAPGLSPDLLAMAGWISPFGANRSGWLNLALTRGAAEKDPKTQAFAQRRLIAAHLSSHYIDWAIASMEEEPFSAAQDSEARLIRSIAKRKLGSSGLNRAAREELQKIDAEMGDKTPLSVLAELLDASRADSKAQLRLTKRLAQIRADLRGFGYVQAFRSEGAAALEIAAAETLGQQSSADDLMRIGRELIDLGRYAWAREVFFVA